MAPRVPELWETVEEQDWWALTYLRYVHIYAVNVYHFVLYLRPLSLSLSRSLSLSAFNALPDDLLWF